MKHSDIEHEGIVIDVTPSLVLVRITQHSACSECHAASLCTTAEKKEKIIEVATTGFPVKKGDKVVISMSATAGHRAVWLTSILPLLLLVLTLFFTHLMGASELTLGLAALITMVVYYTILYFYRDRLRNQFKFTLKKIIVS